MLVSFCVPLKNIQAQVKIPSNNFEELQDIDSLFLYSLFDTLSTKAGFQSVLSGVGDFSWYGPYYIEYQIARIIGLSMMALGLLFLGIVLYGGIIWMTAKGNEEQVKKGRDMIKNGAIGVLIVTTAYLTSYFVARNALNISQQRTQESLERTGESTQEQAPAEGDSLEDAIDSIIQFFTGD